MNLPAQLNAAIVNQLWSAYLTNVPQAQKLAQALTVNSTTKLALDHYAIIDLPSAKTGIATLSQIFSALGYTLRGRDYLAEKQNDFLWMAAAEEGQKAIDALPQIVLADFRLDALPLSIRKIIEKYTRQIKCFILAEVKTLAKLVQQGDPTAADKLIELITCYLANRNWPLPGVADFLAVQEANELLARTLICGRQPNHVAIAAHLLPNFSSLLQFNKFISEKINLPLNHQGGVIKGSAAVGMEQSATVGDQVTVTLSDGLVELPGYFVEFVWRHPLTGLSNPVYWQDFFTGFIPASANRVIESLYKYKTAL